MKIEEFETVIGVIGQADAYGDILLPDAAAARSMLQMLASMGVCAWLDGDRVKARFSKDTSVEQPRDIARGVK